jgi:hypothetical protein
MSISTDAAVFSELRPGERLLWSGRPDPWALFIPADAFLIPFGLFFLAFSIFWTTQAFGIASQPPFLITGPLFIVVGVYYVFGRFFVKVWRKRRSRYAITDRRAFALEGGTMRESPVSVVGRTVTRSRNGLVSVVFGPGGSTGWSAFRGRNQVPLNSGLDWLMSHRPLAFFDVPDGDALLRALDQADSLQQRSR